MSDVKRFDCFSEGMREGYGEAWVRSADYDAIVRERDAAVAAIHEHNDACDARCEELRAAMRCEPYMGRGLRCPDCPTGEKIDWPVTARS